MTTQCRPLALVFRRLNTLHIKHLSCLRTRPVAVLTQGGANGYSESFKTVQIRLKSTSDGDNGDSHVSGKNSLKCDSCGEYSVEMKDGILKGNAQCTNCNKIFIIDVKNIHTSSVKSKEPKKHKIPSPKEIVAYLDIYVVGQAAAKRKLAVAVYSHYKRLENNLGSAAIFNQKPQSQRSAESDFSALQEQMTHSVMMNLNLGGRFQQQQQQQELESQKKIPSFTDTNEDDKIILDKENVLMMGPTGSGKTFILRKIAERLAVPFAEADCTGMTSAGYVGDDVESVITKLLHRCNGDVERAQQGIVFLDEVDKIQAESSATGHRHRDVGGEGVQQALLKMLEGTVVHVPREGRQRGNGKDTVAVDTANILFIGAGAFNRLPKIIAKRTQNAANVGFCSASEKEMPQVLSSSTLGLQQTEKTDDQEEQEIRDKDALLQMVEAKDLVDFGLIHEFVGRFPVLVPFQHMTEEDLIKIMALPKHGKLAQEMYRVSNEGATLQFTTEALRAIAVQAKKRGTGARSVASILENIMATVHFELPDSDIIKVIINEDVVNGKEEPVFIRSGEEKISATN